jgi:hypothetical protein
MANTLNEKELLPDRASLALCHVEKGAHGWVMLIGGCAQTSWSSSREGGCKTDCVSGHRERRKRRTDSRSAAGGDVMRYFMRCGADGVKLENRAPLSTLQRAGGGELRYGPVYVGIHVSAREKEQ